MPTLFRGLSVEPDKVSQVCESIAYTGRMRSEEGMYAGNMAEPNLVRSCAADWLRSPGSVRKKLNGTENIPLSYACGDLFGASFYAHREKEVPVVIKFEVPWEMIRIDGRDFLYTVFTLWDREGTTHCDRVRDALSRLFGAGILSYFEQAYGDFDRRIGLCDIAIHDLNVIRAHHANSIQIKGRYRTRYCSSFQFPATVSPPVSKTSSCPPQRHPRRTRQLAWMKC